MAIGKAIKVAKKISHIDKEYPSTRPNRNISFISPPPIESFLNKKFPNSLIKYIIVNIINPSPLDGNWRAHIEASLVAPSEDSGGS